MVRRLGNKKTPSTPGREGLMVDPLSAKLNYNLSVILMQQGDKAKKNAAIILAKRK